VSAPPIPSSPADLELIAQLKSKLQYAELRIRVLEERLRLMRIEKYGAGGEKLSQAQMHGKCPRKIAFFTMARHIE
jgi:hypothetical protein